MKPDERYDSRYARASRPVPAGSDSSSSTGMSLDERKLGLQPVNANLHICSGRVAEVCTVDFDVVCVTPNVRTRDLGLHHWEKAICKLAAWETPWYCLIATVTSKADRDEHNSFRNDDTYYAQSLVSLPAVFSRNIWLKPSTYKRVLYYFYNPLALRDYRSLLFPSQLPAHGGLRASPSA